MQGNNTEYRAVVIGASAGGFDALGKLLKPLPADIQFPLLIVQHISPGPGMYITTHLNNLCNIEVKEASEKEKIRNGVAYFAPPGYHMLIEEDFSISFSVEKRINYARPSIDVLFETAAWAYRENLVGIILTGANNDGAAGMKEIKDNGGFTIVQDPSEAEVSTMPAATIKTIKPDLILSLDKIAGFLMGKANR